MRVPDVFARLSITCAAWGGPLSNRSRRQPVASFRRRSRTQTGDEAPRFKVLRPRLGWGPSQLAWPDMCTSRPWRTSGTFALLKVGDRPTRLTERVRAFPLRISVNRSGGCRVLCGSGGHVAEHARGAIRGSVGGRAWEHPVQERRRAIPRAYRAIGGDIEGGRTDALPILFGHDPCRGREGLSWPRPLIQRASCAVFQDSWATPRRPRPLTPPSPRRGHPVTNHQPVAARGVNVECTTKHLTRRCSPRSTNNTSPP